MRGRWGGRKGSGSFKFFVNKFWDKINLSDVKTVTSKSDFIDDIKTIEDVDYTEMSGIWDMDSTVQFSKKPPPNPYQPMNVLILASDTYYSVLQTRVENLNNLYYNTGTTFTWDVNSGSSPLTTTSTIANYDVVVVWANNSWGTTRESVLAQGISNGIGVVKCQFAVLDIDGAYPRIPLSISPLSDGGGNSTGYSLNYVSSAADPIMFANATTFGQYYKASSVSFSAPSMQSGAVRINPILAYRETSNNRVVQFNAFPSDGGNSYNSSTYADWGTETGACRVFLNAIYWAGSRV